MHSLLKLVGTSVASLGIMAFVGGADAASSGRAASSVGNARASSLQRMPTMPTLPMDTIGNLTHNGPSNDTPMTPPTAPDKPTGPDKPDEPDKPTPPANTECPDGGVRDSDYTVEKCMNDVLQCVNGGALPNGLAELFDEDKRNAIVNGMGLCQVQVERCVKEVRRDCKNVYNTSADVWIDFNTRKVQPEYYNFVLRKTGLTPNQAKNTCLLLDVNTYGPSFSAVAYNDKTTAEYNKQVGAYNGQHGNLIIKKNPQGPKVNKGNTWSVDGGRGHYARWDAQNADCYLRVAAYNKDTHIKNSWLFGAAGDDRAAEVWRPAGSTFTCNKALFGFSLMNNTSTAAVVGIGGGALLGTGIGAAVGHGKRDFDCNNNDHRKKLLEQLRAAGVATINEILPADKQIVSGASELDKGQCQAIVDIADKLNSLENVVTACFGQGITSETTVEISGTLTSECALEISGLPADSATNVIQAAINQCAQNVTDAAVDAVSNCLQSDASDKQKCVSNAIAQNIIKEIAVTDKCCFNEYRDIFINGVDVYSSEETSSANCLESVNNLNKSLSALRTVVDSLTILRGEKSNMGKSIATGAAIGVGAGGVATAITAVIEHSNINCRVGDGLAQVGFEKSYTIETLKDFYVKWNLHLPDTIAPTGTVTDCASWRNACANYTNLEECSGVMVNYMSTPGGKITGVRSACTPSGSACIENRAVAKSYGACEE